MIMIIIIVFTIVNLVSQDKTHRRLCSSWQGGSCRRWTTVLLQFASQLRPRHRQRRGNIRSGRSLGQIQLFGDYQWTKYSTWRPWSRLADVWRYWYHRCLPDSFRKQISVFFFQFFFVNFLFGSVGQLSLPTSLFVDQIIIHSGRIVAKT